MLTSGQIVGEKYRVESVIGRGGMGVVYAARHVLLDEMVALKVIAPEIADRDTYATRFVREARAASKIRSEHVVRVTDVGAQDDGTLYMAMELLDGCDLERLIRDSGPLAETDAIQYVLQALVALGEAHALGMVHRDLKPANLFLATTTADRPIVKILDFGISKTSDSGSTHVTATDTIIGSPTYMSPEQLRGSKALDHRADIWSMGIVLFELLTAQRPFGGETTGAVFAAILETSAPPLRALRPDASAGVEATISRCLAKDPTARFQDVAELAGELAQLVPAGDVWAERVRRSIERAGSTSRPLSKPDVTSRENGTPPVARIRSEGSGGGTAALESAPTLVQAVGLPPHSTKTTDGHAVQGRVTAAPTLPMAGIGALAVLVVGALALIGVLAVVGPRLLARGSKDRAVTAEGPHVAAVASSAPVASPQLPDVVTSSEPSSSAPPSAPSAPSARAHAAGSAASGTARPRTPDDRRRAGTVTPPVDPFPDQRK